MLRRVADYDRSRFAEKYRQIKGRLGSRLHNEIDWEEGAFRQYEKRCAFLNEENLCDLYIEGNGSGMFCKTCRLYPRHVEEFEGLREISLSLSCPEAANLILGCEEPVHFLEAEIRIGKRLMRSLISSCLPNWKTREL